jgi:ABC-type branched-subunit amino acid transport system ATPase component
MAIDLRTAPGEPLLVVEDLDVSYGPLQVLFGLDLAIHRGEIVALLGTNGAGKSTLFKAVCGLLPAGRGRITFDGQELTGVPTHKIAERGVVMMPGGRSTFPSLTVRDNLRLACWSKRDDPDAVAEAEERVLELFPRVRERIDQLAGNLSGGEQQMLAMSQALIPEPSLLMIDELSLGLAPTIVGQLVEVVREVHRQGVTVVVVEQSVNVALTLADRAVFMEKGQFRFSGATADLLERPDILRSVFIEGATDPGPATNGSNGSGSSGNGTAPKRGKEAPLVVVREPDPEPAATVAAPPALECRGVVKRFGGITAVDEVDLTLAQGQILGLIGQNGAGKTTLLDCISGFLEIDGGRVLLRSGGGMEDITDLPPHQRALRGLGRSFQEAKLFPALPVEQVLAVACERHLSSHSVVAAALAQPAARTSELAVTERVDELIDLMGLGAYRESPTGALSTGTRRIVELACLLASAPSVILLDEPSGGVAQKETEALGPLLRRVQARTGASILVIEHDVPLLAGLCDELCALELGAVIARGIPAAVLADQRVVESYLGTDQAAINRSGAVVN